MTDSSPVNLIIFPSSDALSLQAADDILLTNYYSIEALDDECGPFQRASMLRDIQNFRYDLMTLCEWSSEHDIPYLWLDRLRNLCDNLQTEMSKIRRRAYENGGGFNAPSFPDDLYKEIQSVIIDLNNAYSAQKSYI